MMMIMMLMMMMMMMRMMMRLMSGAELGAPFRQHDLLVDLPERGAAAVEVAHLRAIHLRAAGAILR
jgi:hypothetical protein